MDNLTLLEKIQKLSPKEKEEIEHHLNKLLSNERLIAKKERKAGFAKGAFKMLSGFNDPIEGLEEYM